MFITVEVERDWGKAAGSSLVHVNTEHFNGVRIRKDVASISLAKKSLWPFARTRVELDVLSAHQVYRALFSGEQGALISPDARLKEVSVETLARETVTLRAEEIAMIRDQHAILSRGMTDDRLPPRGTLEETIYTTSGEVHTVWRPEKGQSVLQRLGVHLKP